MHRPGILLTAVTALLLSGCALERSPTGGLRDSGPSESALASVPDACLTSAESRPRTTEIASAKLFIEYNFTDEDLGVHGAFDDDGWKTLCVFDPNGQAVLEVTPQGQLGDLAMAGIFFESREPPSSEFSFADLEAAFPEGEYEVRAESFDGRILVGSATFTHDVPAPPTITEPEIAEEPRGAERNPVPLEDLVVEWNQVSETVAGGPVDITGYEVIVTKEVEDDPHGFSRPIYDVHVPATVDSLGVAADFLEPNTVYELEVLALEESGNQTISVGFFKTARS
jgi:hypothetical protein